MVPLFHSVVWFCVSGGNSFHLPFPFYSHCHVFNSGLHFLCIDRFHNTDVSLLLNFLLYVKHAPQPLAGSFFSSKASSVLPHQHLSALCHPKAPHLGTQLVPQSLSLHMWHYCSAMLCALANLGWWDFPDLWHISSVQPPTEPLLWSIAMSIVVQLRTSECPAPHFHLLDCWPCTKVHLKELPSYVTRPALVTLPESNILSLWIPIAPYLSSLAILYSDF